MYEAEKEIIKAIQNGSEFRSQECDSWNEQVDLPDEIRTYYREFGPVNIELENNLNGFTFPSFDSFEDHYKSHAFVKGWFTKKASATWRKEWLPIAFEGSDPFVFDSSNGKIIRVIHDLNHSSPVEIFSDLSEMLKTIVVIADEFNNVQDEYFLNNDCHLVMVDKIRIRLRFFCKDDKRISFIISELLE